MTGVELAQDDLAPTGVLRVAAAALQVLRRHVEVPADVQHLPHRPVEAGRGQLSTVTPILHTPKRHRKYPARHPQKERPREVQVGGGGRLVVQDGRLRRVRPHLESGTQLAPLLVKEGSRSPLAVGSGQTGNPGTRQQAVVTGGLRLLLHLHTKIQM